MRLRPLAPWLVVLCLCCPLLVRAEPPLPGAAIGTPPTDLAAVADPSPAAVKQQWLERALGAPPPQAAGSASAQDLIGGNFPIANFLDPSTPSELLNNASVAFNSARNEYLVVWQAYVTETSNNIYARRYNASGDPISIIYNICVAPGHQVAPSVAYDAASNQYWVAWTDTRSGTQLQGYLRRLTTMGTPTGNELIANPGGQEDAYAIRVAAGGGRAVAVWISDPGDGNSHILIHCYDQNGNEAVVILLLSDVVGVVGEPDVTYNPEDQHFMIVWEAYTQATGWDARGRIVTRDIAGVSPVLSLEGNAAANRYPRVAYNAQGDRYLVVWQDSRSGTSWDIYGRLVARDGTMGGAGAIYASPYADARPAVAPQGNSAAFLVPFERSLTAGDRMQIYAIPVSTGGALGTVFAVRVWHNVRTAPALASRNGSNEYLIAYTDRGALTQDDIFAQRVRHDGSLLGGYLPVALGRKGQELPKAAYNPAAQEYLVVWQDYRSGTDYHVYGRRLASNGTLLGAELVIANAAMLHGDPVVVYNATSNEYLAVWMQVTSPSSGYDIYAQRLSATGQKLGAAIFVSPGTVTTDEGVPAVAWNANRNEYYVVWHAFTDSRWRICGQRLSAAGQLLGTNTLLSYGSEFTHAARLAYNPQRDEYLVAWQDVRVGGRIDIYAQRVGGAGGRIGDNFPVSTADGSKGLCDIAYRKGHGEYLVVWGDARNGRAAIYGQRLNADGVLVGPEIGIYTSDAGQYAPSVVYVEAGDQYLVSWRELNTATDYDVYARSVSGSGVPGAGFVVVAADQVQSRAEMAYNPTAGQVLLVWDDFRAFTYDIYGQLWSSGVAPPTPTPTPTRTPTQIPGMRQRFTLPIVIK